MRVAERLLSLSADVEHVLRFVTVLLLLVLLVRGLLAPRRPVRPALSITARAERRAIILVLAWVLATCLIGSGWAQQPRWYFPQTATLHIADALRGPHVGRRWLALLGNVQVSWEHQSPIQVPVAALYVDR